MQHQVPTAPGYVDQLKGAILNWGRYFRMVSNCSWLDFGQSHRCYFRGSQWRGINCPGKTLPEIAEAHRHMHAMALRTGLQGHTDSTHALEWEVSYRVKSKGKEQHPLPLTWASAKIHPDRTLGYQEEQRLQSMEYPRCKGKGCFAGFRIPRFGALEGPSDLLSEKSWWYPTEKIPRKHIALSASKRNCRNHKLAALQHTWKLKNENNHL